MEILRGFGNIKPAIKLVKVIGPFKFFVRSPFVRIIKFQKLRDSRTMKSLYSYAIKTVAMWLKESGDLSKDDKTEIAFLKVCVLVKKS